MQLFSYSIVTTEPVVILHIAVLASLMQLICFLLPGLQVAPRRRISILDLRLARDLFCTLRVQREAKRCAFFIFNQLVFFFSKNNAGHRPVKDSLISRRSQFIFSPPTSENAKKNQPGKVRKGRQVLPGGGVGWMVRDGG